MIPRALGTSRFLILIAVIGSLMALTTITVYGGLTVINIIHATLAKGEVIPDGAKALAVDCIEMINVFRLPSSSWPWALRCGTGTMMLTILHLWSSSSLRLTICNLWISCKVP